MAIAAFVVSLLALLVGGLSVLYTRRQAHSSERIAMIERERHHAERTPVLDVKAEDESDEVLSPHAANILITNRAPFPIFDTTVTPILDRPEANAIEAVIDAQGRQSRAPFRCEIALSPRAPQRP